MSKIQAPTVCPSCGSELVWVNRILYCKNTDCGATQSKKLEHFAKTLKIKGLGPASLKKIGFENITEIFTISETDLILAMESEALGRKVYKEIKNAEKAPANLLLPALGIPLVGNTATAKIAKTTATIYDINERLCKEAGLGPTVTKNLCDWVKNNKELLGELPNKMLCFEQVPKPQDLGTVCISGKLKSFKTKAEAKQVLETVGFRVVDNLTKDVTVLLNESGVESSKTKKARDSGIVILTSINNLIGE